MAPTVVPCCVPAIATTSPTFARRLGQYVRATRDSSPPWLMLNTASLRPARRCISRSPYTRYCTETWMSAVVKFGKLTQHAGAPYESKAGLAIP